MWHRLSKKSESCQTTRLHIISLWKRMFSQAMISFAFTYSFTISQDFCARKGNKTSLLYCWNYWTTQKIFVSDMLICSWNAFAILSKDHHPFPLALIDQSAIVFFASVCLWRSAWRVLKTSILRKLSQDLPLTQKFHPRIRLVFLPASDLSRVPRFLESCLVDGWNFSDSRTSSNRQQESSGTHLVQQRFGATWSLCLLIVTKRNDDQSSSVNILREGTSFFWWFFQRLILIGPSILSFCVNTQKP